MEEVKHISICIPSWEREQMLYDSFAQVYDDERVSEIVIVDDCSDLGLFNRIKDVCSRLSKVKLYRNANNRGCYVNKMTAVSYASNEYVILLDSDNNIDKSYIDKIYEQKWLSYQILAPDFARPAFSYKEFGGDVITRLNAAEFIEKHMALTALNTMNFFVNKEQFLKVWDKNVEPMTADSIYFNYCWLKKESSIYFVKDLEYDHLVHPQSHYQNFNHLTGNFYEETVKKLRNLK